MGSKQIDEKRVFLIATANQQRGELYSYVIKKHINNAVIYNAQDGSDVVFKVDNHPPDVLITDINLPKINGLDLTAKILKTGKAPRMAFVIASEVPDSERFVDEVVTGQVQFLVDHSNENQFNRAIAKALTFAADGDGREYGLLFLSPNDVLFKEGDPGDRAYILRRGEMKAVRGDAETGVELGRISMGEFVGEMAHINGEPRNATVVATKDCELIEIPFGTLDSVLFQKPAWSKALISTLSRRLKKTNNVVDTE